MKLLRDQVRRLQERLEFCEDSRIFQDPDSPSSSGSAHVPHQAYITSSPRKPCRESRMQQQTRKDMSILGNVIDCQPARRDPDELHNTSKNLEKSSGSLRREGIEKRGSEEPLQSIPLLCFQERASTYGQERLSHVYDKQCREYWDLYTKWRRCILGKFPDHTEFQS